MTPDSVMVLRLRAWALSLLCAIAGIMIMLILLDRHAPETSAGMMRDIIYRSVRAAPAFEPDT